jgi:hypothetical protein
MSRFLPVLIAAALLVATPALADDISFPPRRLGLWEQSMVSGPTTITSKTCIDATTDTALLRHSIEEMHKRGGTYTVNTNGNQVHVASSVDLSGHKMSMTEDFTLVNDTTVEGRGHIHFTPPFAPGQGDTDIRQDSHWVGPCPADLQPGEALVNGRKVNLLQSK